MSPDPQLETRDSQLVIDEETEQLLLEYQKTLLRRLLAHLKSPAFESRDLARHVAYACKISRQINAARRTAANLEIARMRCETAVKVAEIRADATIKASENRRRGDKLPGELDDPELENIAAPFDRDDTGRPYTKDEFHTALSRRVKEIYGVDFDAAAVAKSAEPGYVYPTPAECQAREAERHRKERQAEQERNEANPSTAPTESSPREAPT